MTTIETHIPQRFNAIEEYYEPHTTFISSSIQQHHEDDAWVQSSSSESESISDDGEPGAHPKGEGKRNKRSAKKPDSDDERPKKRGKAPKKKSASADAEYIPINQYQPNVNSVNIQEQGSPVIRKKKRGRPPKKKPEELMMSIDPSMIKQDSFGSPSGTPSMVTVGSDGKLYPAGAPSSAAKNGILQMMPHPLASIGSSPLPSPVQTLRSTSCFYDKCTFTNKRSSEAPESPNPASKALILHPKFEGQIRGCKKHFEKWKALPLKPVSCELCRGLNIGESVPETEHSKYVQNFVNTKNQPFQLCSVCGHKQAALLGLVPAPKATKMDMIENNLAMTMTMTTNPPESESESHDSDSDSDSSDSSSDSSSSSDSDSDSSKDTETVKTKVPKIKKKKSSPNKLTTTPSSTSLGSVTYTMYKTKPPVGWETFAKGVTYSSSLQYEDQSKPVSAALSVSYLEEVAPFQLSIRKRVNSADGVLFADSDITQGVCIGEFTGRVAQAKRKQRRKFAFIIVDADVEIDATLVGNETRFISDIEGSSQPNIKFELTDGHVVCVALRNIAKGEELIADYGSGHLREREVFYLETFEKIKVFNEENLIGEEKNHSAFEWFLNEGWSLLKQKAKVTVPIDHRLPAKKGLANNFKTAKSFSNSSVKNPLEWGYVAQLEKLDLVRAREDCWVTFKAGKHWNYDAFRNALSLWRLRSPNHHYIPSAPSPSITKKKNILATIAQPQPAQPPLVQNLAQSQTSNQPNASPQPQSSQGYAQNSQSQPQPGFVSSLFANATSSGQNRDRERENNSNNNNPNNNNNVNPAQQFKQDKKAATQALLRANKIPQTAAIHLVPRCQLEEIKFSDLSIKFETSLLGSGKHGYVFKGYWRGFPVAVRFPSLKSQITFEERQKFIRECNQTAVYHPNVVTSYAACVTDQLCLAMEFMNLGNLKQWLMRTSPHVHAMYLSRIALDVARAMDFIHYKGLVHSRLHSNNVLLKGEPLDHGLIAGFEVKISDIGPPPSEDYYYATSLLEQHIDSTPFVAPELAQSKRFTKQSDVYAFGLILCHLFSEGSEEPKSVQEVLQTAHYLQLWDMKWKELILRCTHKNVEQRPSFGEIVDILAVLHLNTTRM